MRDVTPVPKAKPRVGTPKARRHARLTRDYNAWVTERMSRHPLCVMCGEPAQVIHHRRLKSQGGAVISHANTVPLCNMDHDFLHRNVGWAREHHLIVGSDDVDFALLGEA